MHPSTNALIVTLLASALISCTQVSSSNSRDDRNAAIAQPDPFSGTWAGKHQECDVGAVEISSDALGRLRLFSKAEICLLEPITAIGIDGGVNHEAYCHGSSDHPPTIRGVSYNVGDREALEIYRYTGGQGRRETLRRCVKSDGK